MNSIAVSSLTLPGPVQLWASSDPSVWATARQRYPDAVAAAASKGKAKAALAHLDRWYRSELPSALKAPGSAPGGPEPHITKAQLEKLVEWKLARGQWRPRLLSYAKEQPPGVVESASSKALASLRDYSPPLPPEDDDTGRNGGGSSSAAQPDSALRSAVEALTALKGVGPATASALLSAACPHVPYMGDEALATCLPAGRQSDYSLKAFLELTHLLQRKARQLSQAAHVGAPEVTGKQSPSAGGGGTVRQAADVQPLGEASGHGGDGDGSADPSGGAEWPGGDPACSHAADAPPSHDEWSAAEVERCLWAAALLGGAVGGDGGARAGKEAGSAGGSDPGAAVDVGAGAGGAGASRGRGAKRARR